MPTITIETTPLRPPERRFIAVRLTRWFADRGIEPSHVIVKFADADPSGITSGGMPVGQSAGDDSDPRVAWVTCCLAPERDERFRADLAEQITETLGRSRTLDLCYIEFRPTPPSLVYTSHHGRLRRADRPESPLAEGR